MSTYSKNIQAAAEIFQEYGEFIRSVIRFNVRDESLRDDIYQDFFLYLAARSMPDEVGSWKGFLYKVLSDRIKDALRDVKRYQGKLSRYNEIQKPVAPAEPQEELSIIEEAEKTLAVISRSLPVVEAMAIRVRYKDEYDTAEAARKMGVKPRSVSRYLSAGLKKARLVINSNGAGI